MIDKDGYVICMVGESVTLVDTDDSFVVLFNDNNGDTKETFKISKEKFIAIRKKIRYNNIVIED